MIVFDSFIDSLGTFGTWLGLIPQNLVERQHDDASASGSRGSNRAQEERERLDPYQHPPSGFNFANANNFVINHLNAYNLENVNGPGVNAFLNGNTVLQHLAPYANPDAAVDSSARWPPPSCHPGTRATIYNRLLHWLNDVGRQWSFIWLYGSAGCGKSAVAQTFAEKCLELGRLGASFFFSRPNKRNDPKSVIPTIAYQLAVCCPAYKSIINSRLADDPLLLSKAISVQFKMLIVEPFAHLQRYQPEAVREPFLILLDGLDECDGEMAQCEFIRLINELVRVKKDFPLLWVIVSRQEAHIRHTFTRIVDSDRIELIIDDECRNDVDRYLRDGLFNLQVEYNIGSSWPPQETLDTISKGGDGHFAFAATALGFIGDKEYANPPERLDQLVAFIKRVGDVSNMNPLARLDLLYTRILSEIPENIFPTTWRILAHFIYMSDATNSPETIILLSESAQTLCNFINLEQATFYTALRHLYSVIDVPPPKEAASTPIRFYHASFQDFLVDGGRSEQFAIKREEALADITRTLLYWNEVDGRHFHSDETVMQKQGAYWTHNHACLPGLKWTSGDLSIGFCRTEPSDEFDTKLLDYLGKMTGKEAASPTSLPLRWTDDTLPRYREYLFVGYREESLVVLCTNRDGDRFRLDRLCYDLPPSSEKISEYQEWLQENGWYDVDNKESEDGREDDSEASENYSEGKSVPILVGTESEEEDVKS
ncbi:hypothetical protein NP233_g2210 [Leucocoprinus birnbaumii]|uniref:Nephrocystin 3-like N-terminal domain-containing protein n=1 Tax=Leucocoprinus birnbaumii TaxID=56174 RepID=A0AAD5VZE9_9AGAR|nr:hypothetical protein NP233_g2210 [Leucocoprinus birnbaumii]